MNGQKNTSRDEKEVGTLESRVATIERIVAELQKRINLNDRPVRPPEKKNFNPDYLPVGGVPRGLDELPPKVT